jgi:hypothetical protein
MTYIQKTCTCCNTNKPLVEFYKDRTQRDGYRLMCKTCTKGSKSKVCKYCNTKKKVRDFYPGSSRCKDCEANRSKSRSKGAQLLTKADLNILTDCIAATQTHKYGMKICTACKYDVRTDLFNSCQAEIDGYKPICSACERLERSGSLGDPFLSQFTRGQQMIHIDILETMEKNNENKV